MLHGLFTGGMIYQISNISIQDKASVVRFFDPDMKTQIACFLQTVTMVVRSEILDTMIDIINVLLKIVFSCSLYVPPLLNNTTLYMDQLKG